MISDQVKAERLKQVKAHFREEKSALRVVGWEGNKLKTRCTSCDRSTSQHHTYWLKYGCLCNRGKNIAASQRLDSSSLETLLKFHKLLRRSEFKNMNTPMDVECKRCSYEWSVWPGNLRAGHACPVCAPAKVRAKNLAMYGVEHSAQRPEIQEKIRRTMLERYGVEHALQNKDLYDKNLRTAYKSKTYKLGRRVVQIQGYEPQALDWLIREKSIKPSQIVCGIGADIPSVDYMHQGRSRVYHPDIFIPHLNMLCEVKSDYTYESAKQVNLLKRRACKAAGYRFNFLIMDANGTRLSSK